MAAPPRHSTCLGVLLLAVCFSTTQGLLQWKDCGKTDTLVKVRSITVFPDPAIVGKDFSLHIPATSEAEVSGGTITVRVYLFGFPIYTVYESLCDKTACPLGPGDFVFNNTRNMPWYTPAGTWKVQLTAADENGGQLFCENIKFTVVRSAAAAGGGARAGHLGAHVAAAGAGAHPLVSAARVTWSVAAASMRSWKVHLREMVGQSAPRGGEQPSVRAQ